MSIFKQGQRVYVEGDAPEICTANYLTRISSLATVIDEPDPTDDYVKLSIDKVGNERNAWVYVKKAFVQTI